MSAAEAADLKDRRDGHSLPVVEDAELVLFSPHLAHLEVMDHMREVMGV